MIRAYRHLLLVALFLTATLAFAQQNQQGSLNFTILKDVNGKAIRNASVILHPVEKDGSQGKGGFQLKTDSEGKALAEGVPYGKIRVQVIARGYKTYGEDHVIDQPQQDITIRLKPPDEQFSIYK